MKNKSGVLFIVLLLIFTGFNVKTLLAQEDWTSAQKEVWKNVNDYWACFSRGDVNCYMSYIHPDFEGWDNASLLPRKKADIEKNLNSFVQGSKVFTYSIKPLTVKVYGELAFVHYFHTMTIETKDGKKTIIEGRYTDILLKQGNKWVVVGDHGGEIK